MCVWYVRIATSVAHLSTVQWATTCPHSRRWRHQWRRHNIRLLLVPASCLQHRRSTANISCSTSSMWGRQCRRQDHLLNVRCPTQCTQQFHRTGSDLDLRSNNCVWRTMCVTSRQWVKGSDSWPIDLWPMTHNSYYCIPVQALKLSNP